MSTKTKARPVHEIRMGRVKAAVWANDSEHGVRHNVTVSRIYKDAEDKWQDSSSFGRDDLPLVAKVVDRAHDWIFQEASSDANSSSEE